VFRILYLSMQLIYIRNISPGTAQKSELSLSLNLGKFKLQHNAFRNFLSHDIYVNKYLSHFGLYLSGNTDNAPSKPSSPASIFSNTRSG